MISVVVCSVSPDRLIELTQNVAQTVGVEHEIVAIDNRVEKLSLCAAYNLGASRAKYPYLCFAHEDIAFHTQNWGQTIVDQLQKPTTGVIGFAGATGKTKTLSTWSFNEQYHRVNLRETANGRIKELRLNPKGEEFSQVITLDGLCLVVRRDVWAEVRFDDQLLDGFHLYDLDFSTAVAFAGYRNYVCQTISVEHFSRGSFDTRWLGCSEKYHQKWSDRLPLYVEQLTDKEIEWNEKRTYCTMTYLILNRRLRPADQMWERVKTTLVYRPQHPFIFFKFFRYRIWSMMRKK